MIDFNKAVEKARKYCAYQERSQQEVRDKIYTYGLHKREVEQVISQLITENYLSEERFAIAYAGGKFRMKEWGRIKIQQALQQKRVSEYCINKALNEINKRDYEKTLRSLIDKKSKETVEANPLKKNYKVARYAMSRGFEPELVWEVLKGD